MRFVSIDEVLTNISHYFENSELTNKYNSFFNYKLSRSGDNNDELLDYEVGRMEAAKHLHQAFINYSEHLPCLFKIHNITGLPVKSGDYDANQVIGWLEYLSQANDRSIRECDNDWRNRSILTNGYIIDDLVSFLDAAKITHKFGIQPEAFADNGAVILADLLKLIGCNHPGDFWYYNECIIDDIGIRAKPISVEAESLLIGDEWIARKEFERDIKLDLPCSPIDVYDWANKNGFADFLPDSFMSVHEREKRKADLEAFKQNSSDLKPPINSLSDLMGGYADDGWPEKQQDIRFILKKDEWSMSDVLILVDESQGKVRELMQSSIDAGTLSSCRSVKGRFDKQELFFKPNVILGWLKSKKLNLLEQVIHWQKILPEPQADDTVLAHNAAVIRNGKRSFIKKEYYRLSEVAEILDCKVDDLIHFAANDKLVISLIPNERIGKKSNSAITLVPTDKQTWVTIERNEKDVFCNEHALSLLRNGAPEIIEDFGCIAGVKIIHGIPIVSKGEYLKGQLPFERYVITRVELEKLQQYIQTDIDNANNSTFKSEAVADDGVVKPKSEQTTKLKQKALELGVEWMSQQRNEGKDPGVIEIAQYVEAEFRRLDIRGKRDDYLSWSTIKKEFLTGITGKSPNGKGQKKRKQTGDSPV